MSFIDVLLDPEQQKAKEQNKRASTKNLGPKANDEPAWMKNMSKKSPKTQPSTKEEKETLKVNDEPSWMKNMKKRASTSNLFPTEKESEQEPEFIKKQRERKEREENEGGMTDFAKQELEKAEKEKKELEEKEERLRKLKEQDLKKEEERKKKEQLKIDQEKQAKEKAEKKALEKLEKIKQIQSEKGLLDQDDPPLTIPVGNTSNDELPSPNSARPREKYSLTDLLQKEKSQQEDKKKEEEEKEEKEKRLKLESEKRQAEIEKEEKKKKEEEEKKKKEEQLEEEKKKKKLEEEKKKKEEEAKKKKEEEEAKRKLEEEEKKNSEEESSETAPKGTGGPRAKYSLTDLLEKEKSGPKDSTQIDPSAEVTLKMSTSTAEQPKVQEEVKPQYKTMGNPSSQQNHQPETAVEEKVDYMSTLKSGMQTNSNGRIIVLDNGSGATKCGFSGDEKPTVVMPCMIGTPKQKNIMVGSVERDQYIGEEAQAMRGVLTLRYPVKTGIVTNWDDMEEIWTHVFSNEMRIVTEEEKGILVTEAPMNPKSNRERTMQIMFEKFGFPSMYMSIQAVLALYAAGKTTGLICDAGDGVIHTVPIYEGYALSHAVQRLDFSGSELTDYLQLILKERGINLKTTAEREIVRDIKEKLVYVAEDFDKEMELSSSSNDVERDYVLPDGKIITIGAERFRCAEVLFKPNLIGREEEGIHQLIHTSIQKTDIDLRKDLYANVVLSGGTTLFSGLVERLNRELEFLMPNSLKLKIWAPKDRRFSVWSGGSVLSSVKTFQEQMMITQEEYDEMGLKIIHQKCF
jgi:actin, other eukaryote